MHPSPRFSLACAFALLLIDATSQVLAAEVAALDEDVSWIDLEAIPDDAVKVDPMGRFIVDFFCPTAKLVIEIDGDSHAEQADYDAERTKWLEHGKRCLVLRFTNDQVHKNIDAVVEVIVAALKKERPA